MDAGRRDALLETGALQRAIFNSANFSGIATDARGVIQIFMHIPVVVISIVADRARGFALGAAAIMQKPVARQQLSSALTELGLVS